MFGKKPEHFNPEETAPKADHEDKLRPPVEKDKVTMSAERQKLEKAIEAAILSNDAGIMELEHATASMERIANKARQNIERIRHNIGEIEKDYHDFLSQAKAHITSQSQILAMTDAALKATVEEDKKSPMEEELEQQLAIDFEQARKERKAE